MLIQLAALALLLFALWRVFRLAMGLRFAKVLREEARRAVSRWRFRPATYRGEPIDVYYTVTVNFRLQ